MPNKTCPYQDDDNVTMELTMFSATGRSHRLGEYHYGCHRKYMATLGRIDHSKPHFRSNVIWECFVCNSKNRDRS